MSPDPNASMPIFFVLACIVLIAFGFVIAKRIWKGELQKARELAAALGLNMKTGADALEALWREDGEEGQKMIAWLQGHSNSLMAGVMTDNAWRITDSHGGLTVDIFTESRSSGRSSSTYTIVRARHPEALGSPCRLAREGFFTKVGTTLFGLEDHEIGDPDFDAAIRIKASDFTQVALRFQRPEAKVAVRALIEAQSGAFVSETFAQWERQGTHLGLEVVRPALALVTAVAGSFGKA